MQERKGKEVEKQNTISLDKFCKENGKSILITILVLLIAYGMKIFHLAISHDTEAIISIPESLYTSWTSMGRFGLIVLKKIFGLIVFNPYLASIYMFFMLIANAILWEYLFWSLTPFKSGFSKRSWIFPVLFLTAPVMAEQISFLLQAFEVEVAIFLVGVALLFLWKAILEQRRWLWIPAVVLLALSFSCYQSTVPLFIAASIATFLLNYREDRKNWRIIFQLILCMMLAFFVYQITNIFVMKHFGITTNSYISDQIRWGIDPVSKCIRNILRHIWEVVLAKGIYNSVTFVISGLLSVYLIIIGLREKKKSYYLYVLAYMALFITPFMMTILMGQMPKYRTQVVLPFVCGFAIQYAVGQMELTLRKVRKVACIAGVLILGVGIQQSMHDARMFYSEYVQYEEDVRLAVKISDRIDQLNLGEAPQEPVVFIGSRSPQLNRSSVREYENPGHSFYEWAFTTEYGSSIMRNFMAVLGYNYNSPTMEQVTAAREYAKEMGTWPNTDSVQVKDGIIIVKLSNYY